MQCIFSTFISGCDSVKITVIGKHLTELQSDRECHIFSGSQCTLRIINKQRRFNFPVQQSAPITQASAPVRCSAPAPRRDVRGSRGQHFNV